MASSSAVAEFSRPCPRDGLYDVFISFRGQDTRFGFTDTLYRSLLENEMYTFIDGDLAGKVIESLFKIIETSRMAVVVYSENFASSHWCLRELELIMQRWEEKKMMILPIFYKVGVHEVKHPTEKTTEHFDRLISEHDGGAVKKWKDAVIKIGSVSGFVYKDIYGRSEHDFITQVLIPRIKKQLQEWEEGGLETTSRKPHNNSGPATEHHDVFISFMGRDTRYGLVRHLYKALTKMPKDIKTFMHDDRDLSNDDSIVFEVIQRSKMLVVVFSENFASSKRCLRDLVKILQSSNSNTTGQVVLPIFYEVNPSDLTNQAAKGSRIAYYLEKHASDEDSDTLQSWRDAITDLGYMAGWRFSIAHSKTELADFIGELVDDISTTLNRLDEKKESTRNQQARVPAKEENTAALAAQTDLLTSGPRPGVPEEFPKRSAEGSVDACVSGEVVDDAKVEVGVSEMHTALKRVEEEVLSFNDQQQQADETQIEKGLVSNKNIEKGLEVQQEDTGSSTQSFAHTTNTTLREKSREFTGELISIEPSDMRFYIEPEKQSSTCLILSNKTDNYVAFKLKMDTEKPQNYSIHPNKGLLQPRSTRQVIVTMEAQTELLPSLLGEMSKDKFLIQSVKASYSTNDFTNMFTESGNTIIDKFEMAVFYFAPPPRDSSVPDHRAQLADIEKDLACDKNIEKGLKVPQENKCSSTEEEEVYRIVTSAYFQKSNTINRGELIDIEPGYLIFYVEPEKPSSIWLTLTNKTDNNVAFKLKMDTEKQLNYSINPNTGVLLPRSKCQVQVTMEAQTVLPSHEESKDKFLIHTVKANKDSYSTDDFSNLFTGKLPGNYIDKIVTIPRRDSSVPKPLGQLLANKGLIQECMYVCSIDTHPTKPWVLLAFYYGVVSIWNYETRAEEKSFRFDDWGPGCASFIHEKYWIVVGGMKQGFVLVFNYNTYEKVKEFKAHEDSLRCIKVHPTSPYVLTASDDKLVKLWNWENDWACSETFKGHSNHVMDVAFNPKDSRSFASASQDGTIKIWSFDSSVAKFTINAHARALLTVEYFVGNDNKLYLLSGSLDNTVRVWDYASKALVQTLEGHSEFVRTTLVHPKLPIIITGSDDKTIRIWNKDTHRLKLVWTSDLGQVYSIGFIQASDEVVLGCMEGMVVIKIVDAAGTRSD